MKRYTFKLTEEEIRLIRTALELDAERREKSNPSKAKDLERLAEYFHKRLCDIRQTLTEGGK